MVLAAGLGTRLRPLTDDRPKALVEVDGRTLLEIALARLRVFGVREVIINVHHFADMVVQFLKANDNFGMRIEISREEPLLDTGGGLKKAAHFFLQEPNHPDQPFFLHNVDVLSTIDLHRMLQFHARNRPLATLAVQNRDSSRSLLFDDANHLCGRRVGQQIELTGRPGPAQPLAFCGIHVISPRLLARVTEEGAFSIISTYLRLAAQGEQILGFNADEYSWRDLGTPEQIIAAAQDLRKG